MVIFQNLSLSLSLSLFKELQTVIGIMVGFKISVLHRQIKEDNEWDIDSDDDFASARILFLSSKEKAEKQNEFFF